ncbi:hypothetical protein R5R35_003607 [Gryllus longicercus]|uniref:Uncharacterized protein n=1 Tax=Gryllus longicercus TaxID=2509291 RepID=A0AAN9VQ96_9ORTH
MNGGGGGGGARTPAAPPERPEPEREPVKFDVHLRGAPEEVVELVQNIKDVAEQFLYHWKTFPIVLPPPLATSSHPALNNNTASGNGAESNAAGGAIGDANGSSLSLPRRSNKHLNMRDLFIAPSFDELDAVAVDIKGEPRRLNGKQLEAVRERGLHKDKYGKQKKLNSTQLESIRLWGEFEVESINFPGQVHKWQLSQLLQKGTERSHDSLLGDLALALRFLIVTARGRLFSHFFSVLESLRALLTGLLKLLDIVIGVPSLQAHNLEVKIREERCRYLVAELVCRSEFEDSLELLCSFVRRQLRRATTEKFEVERESSHPPVPVPYLFLTPKDFELDLRLFNRDIMRRALPVLISILEKETRGWFLHFRERLISELRTQKLPDEEIEREVNQAVMVEYLQRVYASILTHPDILALGEGIGQLLVQQAQSVVLMHRAVENLQRKLAKMKETLKQRIEYMHPVLSRIQPWMRDKLRNAESEFIDECQWSAHEEALSLCTKQNLHQTVYFLNRDLSFMRDREPVLLKELRKVKTPTRSFQWLTQIWFPSNWVVRRSFQGQSEVIPTVQSATATSITTPRSDPSQPVFLVEKEVIRTTTTRWPMWRWINYCHRTWSWSWNAMFFFGVVIPWCSPVGIRALFCMEPFMPDLELSQVNGTLFPRKSSLTPTLCSRLLALWRHISKSRTHFETKPDTGFIGKGFTRHVNRVWNYFIKGLLGTLAIVVVFPIVCLIASLGSLIITLTAFVWMPLVTLGLHLFMALIYDVDSPDPSRNRYLIILEAITWNIIIQGFLQPILALFVAIVVCPIISVTVLTVGVFRYWLRLVWDSAAFHFIIKKRGRIPASDSFVVKRIAGPGLVSNYFYQIRAEQALAAFEAKMELDELQAYQHQMEQKILQPQKDFSQFVEACFGPFSAQLSKTGPYRALEKEAQDLISALQEKLERRRRDLQTGLGVNVRSKIKLTTVELKIALQQAAVMLERFYPGHVLQRLTMHEEDFWENKGLSVNDWAGLASLMYADIFSLDFLTPLDETDTKFRLEPHSAVDLSRYSEMVHAAELSQAGPDLLGAVYAPRGNIQVHSPYLEVSAFNPRSRASATARKQERRGETIGTISLSRSQKRINSSSHVSASTWQPWKRHHHPYSAEKLLIPLPVPHPAHIAITIHNRDSDDPIPLDSELCQNILKAVEDAHINQSGVHDTNEEGSGGHVARYRGGGDSSFDSVESQSSVSAAAPDGQEPERQESYNWHPTDWNGGMTRKRNNSGSVRVDLASPEDVTLDTDSTRVMFSTYGTTV